MIEFLDLQSAFEHYKRVLGRNGPVETRAKYHCNRLNVEHYNAHTGQFIIGAVFTKGTSCDPGSFLSLLSGPGGNIVIAGGGAIRRIYIASGRFVDERRGLIITWRSYGVSLGAAGRDSLAERDGFEPLVPRKTNDAFRGFPVLTAPGTSLAPERRILRESDRGFESSFLQRGIA